MAAGRSGANRAAVRIGLTPDSGESLSWRGEERLPGESNYFLGNDPRRWRTHVAHYARAVAASAHVGLAVYGNDEGIEYDLRIPAGVDASNLRLKLSGADVASLDANGDLWIRMGENEIRMRQPSVYEDRGRGERRRVDGRYILQTDGTIAFRLGRYDPHAPLVIDPSLSVGYATFLGGAGEDSANSIAMDSAGKIYVAGTTTSSSSFLEASSSVGPTGGASDFFIAKIDPTITGPASLLYLTFLGGSGNEQGGLIAVDSQGGLAIAGTTTSADFPVTGASKRTSGSNDVTVSELDPTGAKLILSTLFGGDGAEATQGAGGIAFDTSGNIFVASDTTSTDLPATSGAFRSAYGGGASDGFLAEFAPGSSASSPPTLKYCTYLGLNAQVGVSGLAVDADGNAYLAGFTSDPSTTFPALNAFQGAYGGGDFDAFLMKIRPSGTGPSDLSYATFLGGSGSDQAFAVQIGTSLPGTAYVTGTTSSTNFPVRGAVPAFQTTLSGSANAFLSVVAQDAKTGMTSLSYSTYLGGSASDSGFSVAVTAANSVYVAGSATSPDPSFWLDNFQPFTGDQDAFVARFDPTSAGSASLLYSTPLGGTAPPGSISLTQANGVISDGLGHVYLAGETNAGDFPSAGNASSGFQATCASCLASPPVSDAFLTKVVESQSTAPSVSFSAAKLNFGATAVGTQDSVPQPAAIVNTGGAALVISGPLSIAGTNASDFSFSGAGSCTGATLAPRASCSWEVGFTPSVVGPEQAFVVVTDNSPNGQAGNTQALQLVGIGDGPLAIPSPASADFGSLPDGATSMALTVTLMNPGNQPLTISNGPLLAGPDVTAFEFLPGGTCGSGANIAPSGSCFVLVAFAPNAVRQFQAQLNFFDDALNLPNAEQVVPLTGTGTAPAPVANLAPTALGFGSQSVGATSGAQVVTLTNLGSASLNIASIVLGGLNAGDFGIVASGTTCPTASGSVPIGASCTVAVNFAPQSAGAKAASLSFTDNAGGSPQTVALTGTAVGPQIQLSPSTLVFGAQTVGTTSVAQSITLSNPGISALVISGVSITGSNASDFIIAANTCPPSIGPSGSCNLNVTFKPGAAGNRTAALSVADNAAGSPQTVELAGTATQAGVALSPTSLSFGNQLVSSPSPAVSITVTNNGAGILAITKISFTGANPGDFAETDNCTGASVSILSGANCAIQVTFKPTASGVRSAALTLTDNAPDSPESVAVSGTGTDFALAPGGGPTSATVTAGQTATYQLEVNGSNGYAGMVAISCAGAPTGVACTVNPQVVDVTASVPAAFAVKVTTTARTNTSMLSVSSSPHWDFRSATILIAAWAGILLLVLVRKTTEARRQSVRWAQAVALVALLAAALAACSSGGSSGFVPSGTPAGTYTLMVTGTAGGTSRTIPLTLIVQ